MVVIELKILREQNSKRHLYQEGIIINLSSRPQRRVTEITSISERTSSVHQDTGSTPLRGHSAECHGTDALDVAGRGGRVPRSIHYSVQRLLTASLI